MAKKTIAPPKPYGYIYLISCDGTDRIKIGYSIDPNRRLKGLRTGAPGTLQLAYTWLAYHRHEQEVHKLLADHRSHLEWFDIAPEVAAAKISAMLQRQPGPVYKQEDLTAIAPRIALKWRQPKIDDAIEIIQDVKLTLDRLYDYNAKDTRTDISYARRAAQKMLAIPLPIDPFEFIWIAADILTRCNSLASHLDSYVATHCKALAVIVEDLADQARAYTDLA